MKNPRVIGENPRQPLLPYEEWPYQEKLSPGASRGWAQGWKAELKCLILGARGCVYQHAWDILKWIGVKGKEEQNTIIKQIAIHSAREAARMLATCAKDDKTLNPPD